MAPNSSSPASFKVYVRWRPLSTSESGTAEFKHTTSEQDENAKHSISLTASTPAQAAKTTPKTKTWNSGPSFTGVFDASNDNRHVYDQAVAPMLPHVLQGGTCNLFAYGHSGSGKTHTIIGYDFEDEMRLGLSMATARDLFTAISASSKHECGDDDDVRGGEELSIAVRLYEIRGSSAFDLLNVNGSTECHVREGADGQTHIRGATELLSDGRVRVRPIRAVACPVFPALRDTVLVGLRNRKTGSSSVHDESSRTHAILELEIVSVRLMEAREALIERESELVPVGKRATDVYIEEQMKSLIKKEDGSYTQNPDRHLNQARIDAAEAEKAVFERRVADAEEVIANCFKESREKALGGKFVFVDLAGSEYYDTSNMGGPKQTPQEKKQGRQISTDLFALKEVIRARAEGKARIPFRSSPLTMVLRSHFVEGHNGGKGESRSAMILTVSPAENMFAATMNTLKYGNLVGLGTGP